MSNPVLTLPESTIEEINIKLKCMAGDIALNQKRADAAKVEYDACKTQMEIIRQHMNDLFIKYRSLILESHG